MAIAPAFGGTNTSVIGFTDQWVQSSGISVPVGRNQLLNGHFYGYVFAMDAYVAGKGATRNVSLQLNGHGATGTVARGAASSANDIGYIACGFLVEGGTDTFRITADGAFYYGRGGSGNTLDNNGTNRSDGALYGQIAYWSAPTAPTAPAVSPSGATGAAVSWSPPTDLGDVAALSGYRLDYSTDPAFPTGGVGTVSVELGNVTSYTLTGLTGGSTYYFRVFAENIVTTAAASWSLASGSVSLTIGSAPTAPTAPVATAYAGRLEVDWTAPAGTLTSYTVELSTDNFATVLSTASGLNPVKTSKTLTGLTPGTLYYARVKAVNSIGTSPASTVVNGTIPARTALGLVRGASVHTRDGYQIELRSDGAAAPTITLGYTPMGAASTFTTIANIPIDATSANHAAVGGMDNLTLVTDPAGGLYVIGRRGDDGSTVLVKYFARTAPTVWSAPVSLSQALPNTGDSLVEFGAEYVPGTGGSPVPSIFLLARRAGTLGTGALSYAVISVTAAQAGTGTLFLASGSDPSFMGAPPTTGYNTGVVDVSLLQYGGTRLALFGNSWAVVDVANGVVTGVVKAADGANVVAGVTWARVLGVSATAFVVLNVVSGALTWSFYSTSGSLLGTGNLAAASAFGGTFTDQWDAYVDTVANVVTVYYLDSTAGARSLSFIDISPTTYTATAPANLTAALGAASSTNGAVRVPSAPVDERRVMVTSANLLTGTKSTAAYVDTTGNAAPNAPVLVGIAGYDATQDHVFAWAVSDPNPLDTESAYELQVQRVSDNVNVVATGSVASSSTSATVVANTLANPVAYRWRVRTTDALGVVGAWSAYSTFTTSAIGTLTITSPATDDLPGITSSSVPIVWSYVQANGYVQTQRRVLVTRTSDSSVLSDTTMQASAVGNYTITGLLSDVEYAVQVSIITNAPGTPTVTVTRLVKPSFAAPDIPVVVVTPNVSKLVVTITNPVPTGSRPAAVRNDIYRRPSTSVSVADFVRVAQVGPSGTYNDHAVASNTSYDYLVTAVSGATPPTTANSVITTAVAPALNGVWIFDPTAPDATEVNYLFAMGRSESRQIATAKTQLIGRTNPLVEFGTPQEKGISISLPVPLDVFHDAAVAYMRTLYDNRRVFCYRDNRGRRDFVSLADGMPITDEPTGGSTIAAKLTRVDYTEAI